MQSAWRTGRIDLLVIGGIISALIALIWFTQEEIFVVLAAGIVTAAFLAGVATWWFESIAPRYPRWVGAAGPFAICGICALLLALIKMNII